MKIRLNKFLAEAGIASRRSADELIKTGKVKINSQIVQELGTIINPETDKITIGDQIIQPQKLVYYALNKPRGIISTAIDEKGRTKVTDLVPSSPRVYPVGRLDVDSEGLIILTNDGKLTQELTHPSFEHEKEYEVEVRRLESWKVGKLEHIKKIFEGGLLIDSKLMRADQVFDIKEINKPSNRVTFKLVLHTGYNRQIRKMCAKIGLEVVKLERTRIKKLKLGDLNLKKGEFKAISKKQII